ncbi:MAG: multiheme c-type cytochrome [Candidatus Brocadiales bacterium]
MRPLGFMLFCLLTSLSISCAYGTSYGPHNPHNHSTELMIAFSGEETGYLEPCGCEKTPMGGIAKRHSLFLSIQQGNQTVLPLGLGDLTGHWKRQDEIKMETLVQALGEMQYVLHNLGEKDLGMGPEVLSYVFYSSPVKLLSSNILLSETLGIKVYPYIIRDVMVDDRQIKIGILGVLSPKLLGTTPWGVEIIPPSEAIGPLIQELKDMDLLILLSHADLEESRRLAEAFPEFQLVISGHNIDHPIVTTVGETIVATSGNKGKYIGLFRYRPHDGKTHLEMVTLDDHYTDSSQMLALLTNYQQRLKDEDLLGRVEKFSNTEGFTYAGNTICGTCHQATFLHWKTTAHALAYETLVRVGHDYDPECVSCHVTGLYYESGFTSLEKTPGLKGTGCEGCHGPGSQHVEMALKGLKTDGYGKLEPRDCKTCHDPEHSSQFQYEDYWQRITHPKEQPKG